MIELLKKEGGERLHVYMALPCPLSCDILNHLRGLPTINSSPDMAPQPLGPPKS
jgi:hypothetical protein